MRPIPGQSGNRTNATRLEVGRITSELGGRVVLRVAGAGQVQLQRRITSVDHAGTCRATAEREGNRLVVEFVGPPPLLGSAAAVLVRGLV